MSEMLKGNLRIEVPFLPPVEYSLNSRDLKRLEGG